jgi:hypothetical protein
LHNIKKVILEVMEKLVNSGLDKDSKSLGAIYVLGSLTLVNSSLAEKTKEFLSAVLCKVTRPYFDKLPAQEIANRKKGRKINFPPFL